MGKILAVVREWRRGTGRIGARSPTAPPDALSSMCLVFPEKGGFWRAPPPECRPAILPDNVMNKKGSAKPAASFLSILLTWYASWMRIIQGDVEVEGIASQPMLLQRSLHYSPRANQLCSQGRPLWSSSLPKILPKLFPTPSHHL